MSLKLSLQGLLIYLTFAAFAATLLLRLRKNGQRLSAVFWGLGFAFALASILWRGIHTGHAPMQNLFEFFLCMAAALPPLSWLTRKCRGIDATTQDAALGLLILFPAGFVFSEAVRQLPPALQSPFFVPHVAAYVAGYVMLARAAFMALPYFRGPDCGESLPFPPPALERAVNQSSIAGFLLVTLGLALGSIWGKVCWGHYWQWDPKEMWSLATWFVYAAYFHWRLCGGMKHPRALAALLWIGALFIVLTLTWINLSRLFSGMHTYA